MLVLTTMFVNVSNELLKTSYMKMVDYWLVFNLFIPFAEVLLHVYMVRKNTVGGFLKDFGKDAMSVDNNGSGKANIKRTIPVHLACWTQLWNLRNSGKAKILWCITSGASPLLHHL